MKMSMRINPGAIMTEILTILVGILLALAANEWSNQRAQDKKLEATLLMVEQEVQYNLAVMQQIHAQNVKAVESIHSDNNEDRQQIMPGLQIRETAWETLLSSGVIENISLTLLKSLHQHYAIVDVYKNISYQTLQNILSSQSIITALSNDPSMAKSGKLYVDNIQLLVTLETSLIENTQNTLELLKNRTGL